MKKILVAVTAALALAGAATTASATTFTGSYATSYQQSDPGLVLQTADMTPGAGTGFTFDLSALGQSTSVDLFHLYTNESSVDLDDIVAKPISVGFNFSLPDNATGGVSGSTGGQFNISLKGLYENGYVVWQNNGNTTIDFGDGAQLQVHLDDAIFNKGPASWLNPHLNPGTVGQATITADFTLSKLASAVPEPMSWAMMLTGFFGLGAALRASRRQGMALSAT